MDLFAGAGYAFGFMAVAYGVPWAIVSCFKLSRRALRRRRPHAGAVAFVNMPPSYRVRTLVERDQRVVEVGDETWLASLEREIAGK